MVHGYIECGGDILKMKMKVIDYYGTFVTFDLNAPIRVSNDGQTYVLASLLEENSALFEDELSSKIADKELYLCLEYCSKQEWNEGILICEREIDKRGLNKVEVKERFEL